MNDQTGLGLTARGDDLVLVTDSERVRASDLVGQSAALQAELRRLGIARAMVCSDQPADLARAIDACSATGADLYVAHTNIPAQQLSAVTASQAIEYQIGPDDRVLQVAGAGSPPASKIYMMTSGTTGAPKIAAHTLGTLLSRIRIGTAAAPDVRHGRWLLTYQPTGFAGIQVLLTALVTEGLLVAPTRRTPAGFHEAALREQITHASGTPTFWRAFLMLLSPGQLPLRQITLGGEAADQATLDRLRRMFPQARITHTYASTEAGVVFAVHDGREGFPADWLEKARPGAELRIRDGRLQIRAASSMLGYVSQSEQPKSDDGWLSTADRCEIHGDRVCIVGREDHTINVGGSKVYPATIEQFLLGLPNVAEARAYGIPNPISGNLIGAEVVLATGTDAESARPDILRRCREALPGYQVPRSLKIVDAIAVRESGKKG